MRLLRSMTMPLLALGLSVGTVPAAHAATELPFSQPAFDASLQEGKPVLVHITAPWCPYCAKQKPILAELGREPGFEDLIVYDVDFDSQKDVVRALRAQKQSTMIAFHGASERGRSTGVTDEPSIRDLLGKTKD